MNAVRRPRALFFRLLAPLRWLRPATIFSFLLLASLVAAPFVAWHYWGGTIVSTKVLDPSKLVVNDPPPWIQADVKGEVVRDGSLATLSLFDKQFTMKVVQAFKLHHWIADVVYVSKKDSDVVFVEVVYRRPVAWVEVVHADGKGLLPVDRDGVVLPTDDFAGQANPAQDYPRIIVPGFGMPIGLIGTQWGDKRVEGAALIAAAFGESWTETGLYRIVCLETVNGTAEPEFELHTKDIGGRIFWGSTPGREESREAPARIKVAHLLDYLRDGGSLDGVDLDLRSGAVRVSPRIASPGSDSRR